MTNHVGDNNVKFPGDNLTPEQTEQDRWLTMARCSTAMTAARSADERMACVETILGKFRDVPSRQPGRQDTAAYARSAVKAFLEALVRPEGKHESEHVHSVVTENVFNEWIDGWLPPPHLAGTTQPRRREPALAATEHVHSVVTENVFNEWIDGWLPPPHLAGTTQPRRREPALAATENVHSVATENVFNEWIDEWLPPPHLAGIKLPRKREAALAAIENVHSIATENVFNEWIDEWLPPSHATGMTLPRM